MSEPWTDGDLLPVGTPIDLDNCAREPIHIPGSIQPRGVLLVVQEPELTVLQASANLATVLGVATGDALGHPLADVIGAASADAIARMSARFGDLRERNPVELDLEVGGETRAFDAILHRESANLLLVELEQAFGPRPFSFPNTYLAVRGAVGELNRAASLSELFEITARVVRELTGFDRVMVYRYDEDYNGEVVAEAKLDGLNPFLGLHYPASDIPAQARALYEKNWIRLIDDVHYTPSPLVPTLNPATGRPMDLTHATLRSVSPIHIEYLGNMGVDASMSISLMNDGKLWGLIACHHYSGSHRPPFGVRAAAEFLGSTLSLRLVDRMQDEELRARLADEAVLGTIVARIKTLGRPLDEALFDTPDLLALVPADGVAVLVEGQVATRGTVPQPGELHALLSWLREQGEGVVVTECLHESAPALGIDPERVSGVLALVLRDGQYVIWFRGEVERTVDWGGDPSNKAIAVREGDTVRLSPRKSFDRWREIVRRRSTPWTPDQVDYAGRLRHSLVEVLYGRAQQEVRLAETLQRSLLPKMPDVVGWDITAHYDPAAGGRIGGDWYDAFELVDGRLALVVGDIAGHGIAAAGTMAQLRNALRAYLVDGISLVEAVRRLNDFSSLLVPGAFATLAVASLDTSTGELSAVVAGHPIPFVTRDGAAPHQAPLVTAPPVGVPGAVYASAEFTLGSDEGLVFFSDGLVERRDEDMSVGLTRLSREVARLGSSGDAESVFNAVADQDSPDDTTVMVLRRR